MLRWALIFLVVALVAGLLGLGNVAGAATGIALTLFWIFLAVCVILFLFGMMGARRMQ